MTTVIKLEYSALTYKFGLNVHLFNLNILKTETYTTDSGVNKYEVGQVYFREIEMAKIRITNISERTGSGMRHTFVSYDVIEGCITGIRWFVVGEQFDKDNKLSV